MSKTNALPPTLDAEQRTLTAWLNSAKVCWCYMPNTLCRPDSHGLKWKSLGYRQGLPEVMIFTPPPKARHFNGVAIKLQRKKASAPTIDCNIWLRDLERQGWWAQAIKGADEAITWLRGLGYGEQEKMAEDLPSTAAGA